MANATLTTSNSVITLVIPGLFPVPQTLQGYAADDLFSTEAVNTVETVMGLDGRLSGGWKPVPRKQTYVLQADSVSVLMFDTWHQSEEAISDAFVADGVIVLPGLNRSFICTKGFLTEYSPLPDARGILQPRRFQITWESIKVVPI